MEGSGIHTNDLLGAIFEKVRSCDAREILHVGTLGSHIKDPMLPLPASINECLSELDTRALCHALARNTPCTHLNASRIQLEETNGQEVANIIRHNKWVEYIDLQWNRIGPLFLRALSPAISLNRSLRSLVLDHNNLTSNGENCSDFAYFIQSIANNRVLESLSLINCRLVDACADAIIHCLQLNDSVHCINVHLNKISLEKIKKIDAACSRNKEAKAAIDRDIEVSRNEMKRSDQDSSIFLRYMRNARAACQESHVKRLLQAYGKLGNAYIGE